jgi:hypothetical protein
MFRRTLSCLYPDEYKGRSGGRLIPDHVRDHCCLSDDEYGSRAEHEAIFDAERAMTAAAVATGVGKVEGNESGGG